MRCVEELRLPTTAHKKTAMIIADHRGLCGVQCILVGERQGDGLGG